MRKSDFWSTNGAVLFIRYAFAEFTASEGWWAIAGFMLIIFLISIFPIWYIGGFWTDYADGEHFRFFSRNENPDELIKKLHRQRREQIRAQKQRERERGPRL